MLSLEVEKSKCDTTWPSIMCRCAPPDHSLINDYICLKGEKNGNFGRVLESNEHVYSNYIGFSLVIYTKKVK